MELIDKSQKAIDEILRKELGKDYNQSVAESVRSIQHELQTWKNMLAEKVNSEELTVAEFASRFNEKIMAASQKIRDLIGAEHAVRLLGQSDAGLLDLKTAAAEDEKRGSTQKLFKAK